MGLVSHKERCPNNPKLQRFIAWWDAQGPFPITIVFGNRTDDEQLIEYAIGRAKLADGSWAIIGGVVTNAQGAKDSAHGHEAAIDCHPVREFFPSGGVKTVYLADKKKEPPEVYEEAVRRFAMYDELAKQAGLETGENYPGICDRPHACDPRWKELPLGPGVSA